MLIGYARVSSIDQSLESQLNTLKKAGREELRFSIFQDGISTSNSIGRFFLYVTEAFVKVRAHSDF